MSNPAPQVEPLQAHMPMEMLFQQHKVVVGLAAENMELREIMNKQAEYIRLLEATVEEFKSSTQDATQGTE